MLNACQGYANNLEGTHSRFAMLQPTRALLSSLVEHQQACSQFSWHERVKPVNHNLDHTLKERSAAWITFDTLVWVFEIRTRTWPWLKSSNTVGGNNVATLWKNKAMPFLPQPKCRAEWWSSNLTNKIIKKTSTNHASYENYPNPKWAEISAEIRSGPLVFEKYENW